MTQDSGGMKEPRTLLMVDPARRFGSDVDRLFSDRLARVFHAQGWTVKWAVDIDDDLPPCSYASAHKILPPSGIKAGVTAVLGRQPLRDKRLTKYNSGAQAVCSSGTAYTGTDNAAARVAIATAVRERTRDQNRIARCDDWAKTTWKSDAHHVAKTVALVVWALIRAFYRVQFTTAYMLWAVERAIVATQGYWRGLSVTRSGLLRVYWHGAKRLSSSIFGESSGRSYQHLHFRWLCSQFSAFLHRGVLAKAPLAWSISTLLRRAATGDCRANVMESADECGLLGLLRRCGIDDLIVFPAAETVHLEMLLELMPSLEITEPLPTTLHMRFTSAPRLSVRRGELDTETIAARLASGSPVRSLVFHAEGAEQAARYAREIGLPVRITDTGAENYGPDAGLTTLFCRHRSADAMNDGMAAPSLVVEKLGPMALVISALWGRVGSSAVFDAQTRYLIDRGYVVIRILIEHWPHFGQKRIDRTATFVAENFEHIRPHHHVIAERNPRLRHLWQVAAKPEFQAASPVRRIQYLLAEPIIEHPHALAWCAKRATLAIVNHLPHVAFAERLTRAPIVLETHDIYSRLLDSHGVPGFVPEGPDGQPLRMAEEKQTWARVAACVNLSPEDHQDVARVAKFSVLARPYVTKRRSARRWDEVLGDNQLNPAFRSANRFDVMLWGGWHDANVRGITWFLEEVVTAQEVLQRSRILLVGRVIEGLDHNLLRSNNVLVAGFVDRLEDFTSRTRVLVIPDQSGTGMSIKAMDTFALGACFASTKCGIRGIDMGDTGYVPALTGQALGADIVRLLGSGSARRERADLARRLYDLNFSMEAYTRAWDRVVANVAAAASQRKMAS